MHSYHLASELVSNRRNPKPRGARAIRLEVARRAREDRRRQP
jgi:hypothetical protein